MIEEDLVALITPLAAIDGRLYPLQLPQDPGYPAITYQGITATEEHSHDGPSGVVEVGIDISCWSPDYAEAKQLARRIQTALNGYRGRQASTDIQSMSLADVRDIHEPTNHLYRIVLQFTLTYSEV